MVDNDLMVVLRPGRTRSLAHLFLNHMLDPTVALPNFGATGYQPPQNTMTPDTLVADGYVPKNLVRGRARPSDFDAGYRAPGAAAGRGAALAHVWQRFKAGRPEAVPPSQRPAAGRRLFWCAAAAARHGLAGCVFSVVPLYVVLCIVFGRWTRSSAPRCRCGTR